MRITEQVAEERELVDHLHPPSGQPGAGIDDHPRGRPPPLRGTADGPEGEVPRERHRPGGEEPGRDRPPRRDAIPARERRTEAVGRMDEERERARLHEVERNVRSHPGEPRHPVGDPDREIVVGERNAGEPRIFRREAAPGGDRVEEHQVGRLLGVPRRRHPGPDHAPESEGDGEEELAGEERPPVADRPLRPGSASSAPSIPPPDGDRFGSPGCEREEAEDRPRAPPPPAGETGGVAEPEEEPAGEQAERAGEGGAGAGQRQEAARRERPDRHSGGAEGEVPGEELTRHRHHR
ncbi:MAG: hypothetical protein BWX64_02664 [Acidobacteria bacterium ADurb.Bin051]|nr:MAG: hypothetical protein BWX64_02664 [Acidobacteria bacterium ADurb.Bin051]